MLTAAKRFGGLILTHNEVASTSPKFEFEAGFRTLITRSFQADGAIIPTWTAVDANNVKTARELWESMKRDGWRVEVRQKFHVMDPYLLVKLNFSSTIGTV